MAATPPARIPFIYRMVFTYIDPGFCLLGLVTHLSFLDTTDTLKGYSPNAQLPPRVEVMHMLDSMAGFFAMLAVLEAVLLRVKSRDAAVWRVFQAGGVLLDLFMTLGAIRALSAEGRLHDVGAWRGDDWRLVVGNAGMGLLRLACALGIGFGEERPKTA